jgi:L-ascorbate metabolism protein UlaG (beta-lactamase superfamily)
MHDLLTLRARTTRSGVFAPLRKHGSFAVFGLAAACATAPAAVAPPRPADAPPTTATSTNPPTPTPTPAPVAATRPPDAPPARVVSTAQPLPANLAVTRIAHATVLLDFDGEQVLTDPWFTETEEYHHGEPLGLSLAQLPKLTAVVASHGHYDHFDVEAFAAYPDKAVPFFVAPGMAAAAHKAGFTNVQELAPWQSARAGSLTVTAAPGEHGVFEVTFVIQGKGDTVYFGGDSKLISALEEDLPKRFPVIDLALLSVNGLQVHGKQVVMSDQEAAKLAGELHAAVAVPTHYMFRGGAVSEKFLSYHGTPGGFAQAAKTLAPGTDARILAPGERLEIRHVAGTSAAGSLPTPAARVAK